MKNLTQAKLTQYVETQKKLMTINNDYIIRATEMKLQSIYKNGYNSKSYLNIIQKSIQNNVEELYALKIDDRATLTSKFEIKSYTQQY